MKKLWTFLVDMADSLAKARTAATLVRIGRSDLAKELLNKK